MPTSSMRGDGRESAQGSGDELLVALPEPGLSLTQDAEWCVVQVDGQWRQVRFHDYDELFSIPGLYEKVIYEALGCNSPRVVCKLLREELADAGVKASDMRVLDLGAGNGMVGEELADLGVEYMVGVDIIPEAASATERDRPGLYEDYHIVDLTALEPQQRARLEAHRFNAMSCIAALGFGDIPPRAFAEAFNQVGDQGRIAFNIKEDFLTAKDQSGFANMLKSMIEGGVMKVSRRKSYVHRRNTGGESLTYVAIIGSKQRDIPEAMIID